MGKWPFGFNKGKPKTWKPGFHHFFLTLPQMNWSTLRSFKRLFQEERLQQNDGVALQQANSHYYSPVRGKAVLSSGTIGLDRPTVESPAMQGFVSTTLKCHLSIKGKKGI